MKKRTLKRLLGLFLIIAIVTGTIGVNAESGEISKDKFEPEGEYDKIFRLQAKPLEAYEMLYEIFTINDDGTVKYPDDFAGAWIDVDKLHVSLVSDMADWGKYRKILKDFDCVVFESAEHSLNDLEKIRDIVFDVFVEENYSIVSGGANVRKNKIQLEFTEFKKEEKEINEFLSDFVVQEPMLLESDFIKREQTLSDRNINENLFILEEGEIINVEESLRGGMAISSTGSFTPGVCGWVITHPGNQRLPGIVTVGHGIPREGDTVRRNGAILGTANRSVYYNNSNGDWATIQRTNSSFIMTNRIFGSSIDATRNITGTQNDPVVGASIRSFGQRNGFARKTVAFQNQTRVLSNSNGTTTTVRGLTMANLTFGTRGSGDSGGPYYIQRFEGQNSYSFLGVHVSSNVSNGGSAVWFTPYVRFRNWFEVRVS